MPESNVGLNVVRWVGILKHKVAVNREASSRSRPRGTELGYTKTIYEPASSDVSEDRIDEIEPELQAGGEQSSRKGISNGTKKSRGHWIYLFVKSCVFLAVIVIVLYIQITNRPSEPKIYSTDDPYDTMRDGLNYTCGCSLPTSMQSPETPTTYRYGYNICYWESTLDTVSIIMFSDSALPTMRRTVNFRRLGREQRMVDGYKVSQLAHDIRGPLNSYQDESTSNSDKIPEMGRGLYVNGKRQPDKVVKITSLTSSDFIGFPPAYLRLAFIYRCNNCSLCSLETVNSIFTEVAGNKSHPWGNCFYYHLGNHCRNASENYYQAKCTLYPTSSIPANFAVQEFLRSFLTLEPYINITSAPLSGSLYTPEKMSFQPSTAYLNFSRFVSSKVKLHFYELVWNSPWTSPLFSAFPQLGVCQDVENVTIYNSSSICNAFATSQTPSYKLRCIHTANVSSRECHNLMAESTVDNALNLFHEVGKSFIEAQPEPHDYEDLVCHQPTPNLRSVPPYIVSWKTPQEMDNNSLSQFLYDKILSRDWPQRSGVCANQYPKVVKARTIHDRPLYLKTSCSPPFSQDGVQATNYCWLSGKLFNLTHMKGDKMEDLKYMPKDANSTELNRFVCYRVQLQDIFVWLIVTIGVLFGWMGTCELVFRAAEWMTRRAIQNRRRRKKQEE